MLGDIDAIANLAVKNLANAKRFYEDTLGLKAIANEGDQVIVYRTGKTRINVYQSEFAGTNKATAVTWVVGNRLEEIAQRLRSKGVRFEHYDLPGMKREGDIHIAGNLRVAWFKDLDGNILNLATG